MTNGGHEEYTLAEGIAQNKSINLESGYIWGVSDVIIDRQWAREANTINTRFKLINWTQSEHHYKAGKKKKGITLKQQSEKHLVDGLVTKQENKCKGECWITKWSILKI